MKGWMNLSFDVWGRHSLPPEEFAADAVLLLVRFVSPAPPDSSPPNNTTQQLSQSFPIALLRARTRFWETN